MGIRSEGGGGGLGVQLVEQSLEVGGTRGVNDLLTAQSDQVREGVTWGLCVCVCTCISKCSQ